MSPSEISPIPEEEHQPEVESGQDELSAPSEDPLPAEDTTPTEAAPLEQTDQTEDLFPPPGVESGTLPISEPAPSEIMPSTIGRFFYYLFNPETRRGRFIRSFLRLAGLIVGVFALGVLATYLLLYFPVTQDLKSTQGDLERTTQSLDEVENTLSAIQQDLSDLQASYQKSQDDLEIANTRIQVLKVLNHVTAARLALAARDGPTAQKELLEAQDKLGEALPLIKQEDPKVAKQVSLRLELAITELNRDPATAESDLENLTTTLLLLDKVFTEQ